MQERRKGLLSRPALQHDMLEALGNVCACTATETVRCSARDKRRTPLGSKGFFYEAAIVLQQCESISGSKYTLRTYRSFFPCPEQGLRLTKKELPIFLP